ncbi:MAG: hypothetical protein KC877_01690 [Candidatus Kaiserbacteria bacterium]|nr:hypothetical protein [Candidatus Kaiserbacteria bacterium]MCB9816249.1 hypothetical protein [Candidatus Nomurabacteria bacterium]
MQEPQIGELSYKRRQGLFFVLVLVFLFTLPVLIFYTTGYRLSFDNEETTIVTVGGMYVTTDVLDVDVYLDEELVEQPRFFRSAYYIQNIEAGNHRVVVQRPDLQTWVKVLPVDAHIVIEAAAFNMPVRPQLRPITEYVAGGGVPVYFGTRSTESIFERASSTVPVLVATTTFKSQYDLNEEFIYVESLFSTTSTSSQSVFARLLDGVERFRFATTTAPLLGDATTTPELPIERGNIRLVERDEELYAVWQQSGGTIPPYFCVSDSSTTSIAVRYGEHVADQIELLSESTTTPLVLDANRLCRPEIKLDRQRQDVYFYDFFPRRSDLVLLQLEDGLYVTEIDDRAWQNSQLLYPGTDFQVVVENDEIYIRDNDQYFAVVTEIEPI